MELFELELAKLRGENSIIRDSMKAHALSGHCAWSGGMPFVMDRRLVRPADLANSSLPLAACGSASLLANALKCAGRSSATTTKA